ncbi:hypothetical protein PoB_006959900 [Plakobranchus ocellatus]|uniref:Uncharacterized protein n=1 Tax=Plakobranchus ocellatus TaxID=259542 RepID=A0AAV4DGD4_9GAST|nr:hypothetical protein PoB_006959900 [Plakobranchus ocellatus]
MKVGAFRCENGLSGSTISACLDQINVGQIGVIIIPKLFLQHICPHRDSGLCRSRLRAISRAGAGADLCLFGGHAPAISIVYLELFHYAPYSCLSCLSRLVTHLSPPDTLDSEGIFSQTPQFAFDLF